jgi:putative N6-adenine-specific DNA methylase
MQYIIVEKRTFMDTYELVVPCHFGLEAVTKREIYDLGYEITRVEDGRVTFAGDTEAICRANIFLRSAERVLLQVGRFRATTFDELFEGIKALPWEDYIPKDGKFWVKKASSIKRKLIAAMAATAIQINDGNGTKTMPVANASILVAKETSKM